jgi:hypothetical protein
MRIATRAGQSYRLPNALSEFQEDLYIHLIDWKRHHVTTDAGQARGVTYDAILPESVSDTYPMIYEPVRAALADHLKAFPFRLHKYFHHAVSSQAANINLFLPILRHPQAASILRCLKPELARIAVDHLDHGYRIEFWDEGHGVLGDKTEMSGTDSDLGIAYYDDDGALCLWLIEHKLTEPEFTTCGGFTSPGRKERHDCSKSFADIVASPFTCYYHDVRRFNYWDITARNREFFSQADSSSGCPFSGGLNQLWRNQLLALAVAGDVNQPFQKATFSVVRHPRNRALDGSIAAFRNLIGNSDQFSTFTSLDFVEAASAHADAGLRAWIQWYRDLYDV